jgi:hypothetical protein
VTRPTLFSGLFAVTLAGSAALLFISEPLIARMLLPVAGGAAAVWTTCLVFFQVALLVGYLYAHLSSRHLAMPLQVVAHVAVLILALMVAPFDVASLGSPAPGATPIPWLLQTLSLTIGLPFVALAGTTPLVQSWFSRAGAGSAAYALYSASNFGSVAGLLAYPAFIEPAMRLNTQSRIWTIGYGVVLGLIAVCGILASRSATSVLPDEQRTSASTVSQVLRLRWILLAAMPSSLTMSVTTFISTDIAAIPLLWVAPLALYLVSFIVAFARPGRGLWAARVVPIAILPPIISILTDSSRPAWLQIPAHLATFFIVSLACHQSLARSRPEPSRLPEFYLWLALGGAVGGLTTALIAPLIFPSPIEYPIGLLCACYLATARLDGPRRRLTAVDVIFPAAAALLVVVLARLAAHLEWPPSALATRALTFGPSLLLAVLMWPWPRRYIVTIAAALAAGAMASATAAQTLVVMRSFYGVHRVQDDDARQFHMLFDGSTIHGIQRIAADRRRECVGYYSQGGPVGEAFGMLRREGRLRDIAVLGLGAGSLACYAEPGDRWTFFEIDPSVATLARTPAYFTYLSDSPVSSEVVIGDARLSLASRAGTAYDLIVVDVFSSDAIPVHLLTSEAFRVYMDRLAPRGRILFHTSNLYFNLRAPVGASATSVGLSAVARRHQVDSDLAESGVFPSEWILVARTPEDLAPFLDAPEWRRLDAGSPPWTDDHSSLLSVLTLRR